MDRYRGAGDILADDGTSVGSVGVALAGDRATIQPIFLNTDIDRHLAAVPLHAPVTVRLDDGRVIRGTLADLYDDRDANAPLGLDRVRALSPDARD